MQSRDNTLITKIFKTIKTTCKIADFQCGKHKKTHKKRVKTLLRYREGGRTVGSGRVASIIE